MAVDEAILEAIGAGDAPPTLRLYAWEPACLSLGYAQPAADVDRRNLASSGWDLVRRPTGGRAILHTDEITYSVIGPQEEPRLSGSLLECYRRLAAALLEALHRLGIDAQSRELFPSPPSAEIPDKTNPICFEVPSTYEIVVEGKKLIGSAQARRKEGVLQHGSLPLGGDLSRITRALLFPDEAARARAAERLLERAITAGAALRKPVSWDQAAEAFVAAFSEVLNLDLLPASLTPGEISRAEELVREKYANSDWTLRK